MMSTVFKFSLFFLLCFFEITSAEDKKSCTKLPNIPEPTVLAKLRKKLKCKYDMFVPPTNTTHPRVDLGIYMDRHRIEYFGNSKNLFSYAYFLMTWRDDRLAWNASEYQNRTYLYLKVSDIWTPTVAGYQYGSFRDPPSVLVSSTGEISYLLWWEMTGDCEPKYAKWSDERLCTVIFQIEPYEKLNITEKYFMLSRVTEKETSWGVFKVNEHKKELDVPENASEPIKRSKFEDDWGLFKLEIQILRNMAVVDATLFSPAAVLFLLILASTWIPSGDPIRIAVLALTTLLEIFLMHFANRAIPTLPGRFSDFTELYRDMIVVSGFAFLEWYVSYLVACKKFSPAGRLESVAGTASQASYGFIRSILLIPSNPPKVLNGSTEGAFLSIILDRIAFVILVIVFIFVMVITGHRPQGS